MEVDDDRTPLCGAALEHDSDVALLDSDGEGSTTLPPNSPWEGRTKPLNSRLKPQQSAIILWLCHYNLLTSFQHFLCSSSLVFWCCFTTLIMLRCSQGISGLICRSCERVNTVQMTLLLWLFCNCRNSIWTMNVCTNNWNLIHFILMPNSPEDTKSKDWLAESLN